jgi:hypothetical protein
VILIVVLNTTIDFIQERQAEHSVIALTWLVSPVTR